MKIGIPKEIVTGERRVALAPDAVAKLVESGLDVVVETGAGDSALFADDRYIESGAKIEPDVSTLFGSVDMVLKVQAPVINSKTGKHEVEMMTKGTTVIALLQPLTNLDLVSMLKDRGITSLSMDTIPRIARAQSMDALSSMSSLAGYKAALIAANSLTKYFPMMITAAGTYPPAKGLVLGAGVAGLQAIATSRRLGAVMEGFDVRPIVREQVESLGAVFVGTPENLHETETPGGYAKELAEETQKQERDLIKAHAVAADFIISTALIPGRRAPLLIPEDTVKEMKPGSVIVDLAAEAGGNCENTEPGTEVVKHDVIIHGPLNLPSTMPVHATQMYSRNISNLVGHLIKDRELALDFEDQIIQGCCITFDGKVVSDAVRILIENAQA